MGVLILTASVAALIGMLTKAAFDFVGEQTDAGMYWLKAAAVLLATYIFLLFAFALATPVQILRTGETQCFGNWCTTVTWATFGNSQAFITLRVQNKASTGELRPASPRVNAVDSRGRAYAPGAQSGLALELPLKAGETFNKEYRFYLQPDSERPRIEVTEGAWYSPFVIGNLNSPFHKKPFTPVE